MHEVENYENLVIGSGEASKSLAWTLAKAGRHGVGIGRSGWDYLPPNLIGLLALVGGLQVIQGLFL